MSVNIQTKVIPFGQVRIEIDEHRSPVKERQEILVQESSGDYHIPQETAYRTSDLMNNSVPYLTYDPEDQALRLSVSHINFELLIGKIASNWEVTKPLLVKIEEENDGSYLVNEDLFAVYGVGDTSYSALQDYIASLIEYRRKKEKLIKEIEKVKLPTEHGEFDLHLYESLIDNSQHIALVKGEIKDKPALVRVHSECLTGDTFLSCRWPPGHHHVEIGIVSARQWYL